VDLKEEAALRGAPERHWYYASKARMMAEHAGRCRSVLDVGAGSGFFSHWMLRAGLAEQAVCVDPGYPEERDETVAGRPIAFRRSVAESDADLVLMMDVLEHVDDELAVLRAYLDLASGARLLITVPAFEAIWSAHDDFLEHRRRYTLASLRRIVAASDAREISGHYYFGAIFPLAATMRLLQRGRAADRSDLRPAHPAVNAVLEAVCGIERRAMRLNRLAGLSVVMTCRR
jgi:SAM-dependent methyltransferase